jgi:prephenate dehydratase
MSAGSCDAAYQGDPGAYSEQAAWALVGETARLLPCRSLVTMFDAVAEGRARHAVLPIENTLAGTVPRAYELLLERGLVAAAETRVRIDHVLIGPPGAEGAGIRRVLSHPVALDQCRKFLASLRDVEPVPVFDTAGAVSMALADETGHTAAIASRRAAALHGADILAERIQDHDENWTRFLLLAASPRVPLEEAEHAILAFTLPHEPGALARVLNRLAERRANITKIESRPIEGQPFEYAFLLEMQFDPAHGRLPDLVIDVRAATRDLRLLGAY